MTPRGIGRWIRLRVRRAWQGLLRSRGITLDLRKRGGSRTAIALASGCVGEIISTPARRQFAVLPEVEPMLREAGARFRQGQLFSALIEPVQAGVNIRARVKEQGAQAAQHLILLGGN